MKMNILISNCFKHWSLIWKYIAGRPTNIVLMLGLGWVRLGSRKELPKSESYNVLLYEGRSESKERFAIQRYLLIIGKKQNMQVLSHTFTYFST
jgi:hypothetical protein